MSLVHVDSPGRMPVPRKRREAEGLRPEGQARKRQLRHPNGERRVKNVSISDASLAYVRELGERWGLSFAGVIGKLIHEEGRRETPPRDLPFDVR